MKTFEKIYGYINLQEDSPTSLNEYDDLRILQLRGKALMCREINNPIVFENIEEVKDLLERFGKELIKRKVEGPPTLKTRASNFFMKQKIERP